MPADLMERLRAADPARDVDPAAPEALLEQLKTPRRAPARPRRLLRALVLLPIAAAAATVAVLTPGAKTDLAARAYAQTAPAGDQILYVRTTIETKMRAATIAKDTHAVLERWQQGDRWRQRTDDGEGVSEQALDADGRLRVSEGVVAMPEGAKPAAQSDFIEDFRKRYERGTLDESGPATFDGHPARRYVV